MTMNFKRKLTIPKEIKEQFPLSETAKATKQQRDEEMFRVFDGTSDKLLLIIGPCSADREEPVMEYMTRLREVQEKVADKLLIIPRVYTNKPRTVGTGYKGMLHQPDPEKAEDMLQGIIAIRQLHTRMIEELGFTCADEMLYPENYHYLEDILSYVAVGARSVENQQHRLTASGIKVPVGMKNPTEGDLTVMMNSIVAAQHDHTFIYRGWEVTTSGNPYAHAILRGYVDRFGHAHPNYHYEDLRDVMNMYQEKEQLVHPGIVVDCNHSNSGKKYLEQGRIAKAIRAVVKAAPARSSKPVFVEIQ